MSILSIFRKNSKYEDSYKVSFGIDFFGELSDGALIFKIIDEEYDPGGHIVKSAEGKITIIANNMFYNIDEEDEEYLKRQVQKFCAAL